LHWLDQLIGDKWAELLLYWTAHATKCKLDTNERRAGSAPRARSEFAGRDLEVAESIVRK